VKDIALLPSNRYGYDFIPPKYLPPGEDEYWRRNEQAGRSPNSWRRLKSQEIEILVKNDNFCANWDHFLVSDPFDPSLIRNSNFYGLIRIGALRDLLLQHHDFRILAGIRNSTIISCDIGDDAAIQDCSYISHYIISEQVILSRIDELQTTNHAKFGNGVLCEGEEEDVRIRIDVMNEAGGRSILPFADMIPADAFLWAAYRDDRELMRRLFEITQDQYGGGRGSYGLIGAGTVIKSCLIIKDVMVGRSAYIKGANKLKNISILSSEEESTQIGEGVELVNGIVGYGCHVFYGSKAVRFVMGRNCNLKYGARLIHSVLGDNSTISCCEILNNLIFPFHEQHHNNSFLIASLLGGMSNMAAAATIGSNHNSRANDGELRAGRGFWPGLSVSLKHSSRFASYVLIVKGNYPYELNITLPFSLVNHNVARNRLEVMPAYFWMYNLYALERNSWKAFNRDKRRVKVQHIEMNYLAPDTAEEIIAALGQMETWMAAAGMKRGDILKAGTDAVGGVIDDEDPEYEYSPQSDEVLPAEGLERHNWETVLLKPRRAYLAYREMLLCYAMTTLIGYWESLPKLTFQDFLADMRSPEDRVTEWVNLGGQIVPAFRVDALREEIRRGTHGDWLSIHRAYDEMARAYPLDAARHAWAVLNYLRPCETPAAFRAELEGALEIKRRITEAVYRSRAKDFHDPFRAITYRNKEEMEEVVGKPENLSFVKLSREKLAADERAIKALLARIT
jgi:NDP-sugar pyrophosphorylase family protein